jgi:hypothetical protein
VWTPSDVLSIVAEFGIIVIVRAGFDPSSIISAHPNLLDRSRIEVVHPAMRQDLRFFSSIQSD